MSEDNLRVWWIQNPPAKPSYYYVNSVDEAKRIINGLIKSDLESTQVRSNAGGLEVLEDGKWTEWHDKSGFDIMEIIEDEQENKEIKRELKEEIEGRLTCEHCGADIRIEGITEVTEGGTGETEITIENGYIKFGHTAIQNLDNIYARCNNCNEELEEPIDELIWAMQDSSKELPDEIEVIEAYQELWMAVENGKVDEKFFELREKARKLLSDLNGNKERRNCNNTCKDR